MSANGLFECPKYINLFERQKNAFSEPYIALIITVGTFETSNGDLRRQLPFIQFQTISRIGILVSPFQLRPQQSPRGPLQVDLPPHGLQLPRAPQARVLLPSPHR